MGVKVRVISRNKVLRIFDLLDAKLQGLVRLAMYFATLKYATTNVQEDS